MKQSTNSVAREQITEEEQAARDIARAERVHGENIVAWMEIDGLLGQLHDRGTDRGLLGELREAVRGLELDTCYSAQD